MGSFSVGYIAWLLNGGALVASMITSLPVWQSFDPLPILDSYGKTQSKAQKKNKEKRRAEQRIENLIADQD
jgi:hypothetical protein